MKTAIIYSGNLRSWEQNRPNHEERLWREGCDKLFYTYEEPLGNFRWVKPGEQLMRYSVAYDTNKAGETSCINTLNQWRNRKAAFEMMSKGYDVYVIARPDIIFGAVVTLDIVHPGVTYIPYNNDHRDGTNDQFAYGDYEAMSYYVSMAERINDHFNDGCLFHPETLLKHHLKERAVVRVSTTNDIIRL